MRKLASLALAISVAACSSDNPKKKTIDAAPTVDALVCGSVTAPEPAFDSKDTTNGFVDWIGKLPTQIDNNDVYLAWEFYGGIEPSLAGTFDLSMGKQTNYGTCGICMHAIEVDSSGSPVKDFFQFAGSITLSKDPIVDGELKASVTGLQLQEVTIDQSTFNSTPVSGGTCSSYADQTVDEPAAPAAWTCAPTKFQDNTSCDCMCGMQDPDCSVDANPVTGCTVSGNRCFAGTCVTPPGNQTCANATALVLATPQTGTTIGAAHTYSAGLDGQTCTGGVGQNGPGVAYSVALTAATSYTVTLSGVDAMYDASVALVGPGTSSVCDANPITTCVAGADTNAEGMGETFTITPTATGTYYLIVGSFYPDEAGAFTIEVTTP